MMLCLALNGDVTVSSRKMYYRVYENSSGLKTPFARLMISCSRYESDVAAVIKKHGGFASRLMFRFLIRIRNGSMMTRRLFGMYRRRMGAREFFASSVRLVLYFAGINPTYEKDTRP
jgi:hypothetical protein